MVGWGKTSTRVLADCTRAQQACFVRLSLSARLQCLLLALCASSLGHTLGSLFFHFLSPFRHCLCCSGFSSHVLNGVRPYRLSPQVTHCLLPSHLEKQILQAHFIDFLLRRGYECLKHKRTTPLTKKYPAHNKNSEIGIKNPK